MRSIFCAVLAHRQASAKDAHLSEFIGRSWATPSASAACNAASCLRNVRACAFSWRVFCVIFFAFLASSLTLLSCDDGTNEEQCEAQCEGRECGSDNCGGFCGTCSEGFVCKDFHCVSGCEPQCEDRLCGDDGCGGLCGTCADVYVCDTEYGRCKSRSPRIYGSLFYEAKIANFLEGAGYKLNETTYLAANALTIKLRDSHGKVLGSARIDEDGSFVFNIARSAKSSDWLSLTPLWPDEENPKLTLLKAVLQGEPSLWSWRFDLADWGAAYDLGFVGEIKISLSEGSGALFAYQQLRRAMEDYADYRFSGFNQSLASLAILWAPDVLWNCGACFVKLAPQRVAGQKISNSSMYISGGERNESVWGYPTLLHEFGHYIAAQTRDNTPGGTHYFGSASRPTLAWSEGWASFYAITTLSRWNNEPQPRYWRILENGSFWLDYETNEGSVSILSPKLDASLGMKQYLDEAWVSRVLWQLWDKNVIKDSPEHFSWKDFLNALHSKRYISLDRGSMGADFVDYIDALLCQRRASLSAISALLIANMFPYDENPLCP
ncbi:MAG: hypothetical protein WC966_02985 [Bradymonadales bacterium]